MYTPSRRAPALALLLLSLVLAVSACGSSSSSSASSSGAAAPSGASSGASGVTVTGAYGTKPTITIPASTPPTTTTSQVLTQGTGPTVTAGDELVANYVGEVWSSKKVFDSTFDPSFGHANPTGFVIGEQQVIPGWDKTLVGQKVGSRVLLTIPPADGYGTSGNSQAGISGTDTLVFVVDIVGTYKKGTSAPSKPTHALPAKGWPTVTNVSGKEPKITSVAGVTAPKKPASKLIATGTGAKIDPSKQLVLELVQEDVKGKEPYSTWTQAPQVEPASSVFGLVSALKGQSIGARAVVLVPPSKADASTGQPASPGGVLVVDVVGQI